MAIRAVFFDVGETLVDEERYWREMSSAAGVGPHVIWAALGETIERGEEHWELWRHLGVERPVEAWDGVVYSIDDFYPDALACLTTLRARRVSWSASPATRTRRSRNGPTPPSCRSTS